MKDRRGIEINPGDTVIYAGGGGTNPAYMVECKVTEVLHTGKARLRPIRGKQNVDIINSPSNKIIVVESLPKSDVELDIDYAIKNAKDSVQLYKRKIDAASVPGFVPKYHWDTLERAQKDLKDMHVWLDKLEALRLDSVFDNC